MQSAASDGKLHYFISRDEFIIVLIPIIGLVLSIGQIIFFRDSLGSIDQNVNKLLIGTLLLNTVHVIFPFVMVAMIPAWRSLAWRKISPQRSLRNTVLAIVIFSALFVLSLISVSGAIRFSQTIQSGGEVLLLWIFLLVPVFHGIRQSAGFSLLISRGLMDHVVEKERANIGVAMQKERRLQLGVNLGSLLILTSGVVEYGRIGSWNIGIIIGSVIAFGCATAIMRLIFLHESFKKTNKLLFALRFYLWPLSAFTVIGGWFVMLMHGAEYIGLFRRVAVRSVEAPLRTKLVGTLLVAVTIIIIYRIFDFLQGLQGMELRQYVNSSVVLTLILAMFPLLVMGHYIVDAVIYRMSDPEVASCMKPSLSGMMSSQKNAASS